MEGAVGGTAHTVRVSPGEALPEVSVPLVGGGQVMLGRSNGAWRMIVVYRGRHCPRCKTYFRKLNQLLPEFATLGVEVIAVSADPQDRAAADRDEFEWGFSVAYGLDLAMMRRLGLYISNPTSPAETDRPFPEPAMFVLNPKGQVHVVSYSNAASCRPDLDVMLDGIRNFQARNMPIRGTAA